MLARSERTRKSEGESVRAKERENEMVSERERERKRERERERGERERYTFLRLPGLIVDSHVEAVIHSAFIKREGTIEKGYEIAGEGEKECRRQRVRAMNISESIGAGRRGLCRGTCEGTERERQREKGTLFYYIIIQTCCVGLHSRRHPQMSRRVVCGQ